MLTCMTCPSLVTASILQIEQGQSGCQYTSLRCAAKYCRGHACTATSNVGEICSTDDNCIEGTVCETTAEQPTTKRCRVGNVILQGTFAQKAFGARGEGWACCSAGTTQQWLCYVTRQFYRALANPSVAMPRPYTPAYMGINSLGYFLFCLQLRSGKCNGDHQLCTREKYCPAVSCGLSNCDTYCEVKRTTA